jgi:hypothetical protein
MKFNIAKPSRGSANLLHSLYINTNNLTYINPACLTLQEVIKLIIEELPLLTFEEFPLVLDLSVCGTSFGGGTGFERDGLAFSTGLATVSPLKKADISIRFR